MYLNVQKKEVEGLKYIGRLDKNKLGKYKDIISTDKVVLTPERKHHIYTNHLKDFNEIMENIERIILEPNEILEDCKNKSTILVIGKLINNHLNIIIKLNTTNDNKHPENSIMTAWIIREKNLIRLREKNITIYRSE